jgi:hypothetical protein
VFHVHAARNDSRRAVDKRQRPAPHVRHDPVGDALVVLGELQLGDPLVGINQTVGMGNADAGDRRAALLAGMSCGQKLVPGVRIARIVLDH